MPLIVNRQINDTTSQHPFDPDSLPHVYTYAGPGGLLDTDTCTNGKEVWKKTYTFTGSNMTGESGWVKQ
jgi:hypothetical protein